MALEYGIVLERYLPTYMNNLMIKMDAVYIPRLVYILSWVPVVNRYLPTQGGIDNRARLALECQKKSGQQPPSTPRGEYSVHSAVSEDIYS